ncbi:hypothetical protein V5O48_013369 [Marasmius crinis-equi]|uniref:F-box domain-containing protein n=1 Tax=Marasmius crinis-equi TaxID=585013 RepID=A0ABR3F0A6_9AGAR
MAPVYIPPEIIYKIFEQCRSSTTLRSMALASRMFYDIFLTVRWRSVDDMRRILVALCRGSDFTYNPTKDDWQYFIATYASRIRHLTIEPTSNITIADCEKLVFVLQTFNDCNRPILPNLQSITFVKIHSQTSRTALAASLLLIGAILQSPSVTKFHFYETHDGLCKHGASAYLILRYLTAAVSRLPLLKDVSIRLPGLKSLSETESRTLSELFSVLPKTMTRLSLSAFTKGDVILDQIQHLDNLEYLSQIDGLGESLSQPGLLESMTALHTLGLVCSLSGAIEFTSWSSGWRLTALLLVVETPIATTSKQTLAPASLARIFDGVAKNFPNLSALDVRLVGSRDNSKTSPAANTHHNSRTTVLAFEHLSCLSSLVKMVSFQLLFLERAAKAEVSLDNDELRKLVSQWPRLEALGITRPGPRETGCYEKRNTKKYLDLRALHVLAQYCPRLRALKLDGTSGVKTDGFIFAGPDDKPGYAVPNLRFLDYRKCELGLGDEVLSIRDVFQRGVIEDVEYHTRETSEVEDENV